MRFSRELAQPRSPKALRNNSLRTIPRSTQQARYAEARCHPVVDKKDYSSIPARITPDDCFFNTPPGLTAGDQNSVKLINHFLFTASSRPSLNNRQTNGTATSLISSSSSSPLEPWFVNIGSRQLADQACRCRTFFNLLETKIDKSRYACHINSNTHNKLKTATFQAASRIA